MRGQVKAGCQKGKVKDNILLVRDRTVRRIVLYGALCICSFSSLSCRTFRSLRPIQLVPSTSVVVASIRWAEVREDDRLRKVIEGDEIEKMLQELLHVLEIPDAQIVEALAFSEAAESADISAGMILSGSYDARAVIRSLEARGWNRQTYRGYKLYSNPAEEIGLTLLRSGLLVSGTLKGIKEVIDVELNPDQGLASSEPFDRLEAQFGNQQYPISAIIIFPQSLQDVTGAAVELSSALLDFAGLGPLGEILRKIGFAKGLGFSIARRGDSFPVELVAIMKDEEAAGFISGVLNLLKEIGSSLPPEAPDEEKRIRDLSVDRDGAILKVQWVMTEEDLLSHSGSAVR